MPDAPPTTPSSPTARFFPCKSCGAQLEFEPGTAALRCPYCGAQNDIPAAARDAEELDYAEALARLRDQRPSEDSPVVECQSCRAVLTVADNVSSFRCPFCGTPIVSQCVTRRLLRPSAVLPFAIPRQRATDTFRQWIASRWFAPSSLKRQAMLDAALAGVYIPSWTYDFVADTEYTGQRGEAYWETRTVTVNGRRQAQRVRKIRWYPAAGRVRNGFDDVLIVSAPAMEGTDLHALEPWDLKACLPYRDEYLAGFRAEAYTLGLEEGFAAAQNAVAPRIEASIRADIGGDEQRITSARSRYSAITFKYVLLPVWISAYRYGGKLYRVLVNARTGEVQGMRPYSAWKIALAVAAALLAAGVIAYLVSR